MTEWPLLHLDEAFTTKGRVVKGMAVVNGIFEHRETDAVKGADVALQVYRRAPVTKQFPDAEVQLRSDETGYRSP